MRTGRPRTPIGTHGAINTRRDGGRVVAETRVRDVDGRLRQVRASGPTAAAARTRLMERIRERPSLPSSGVLRPSSSFADLADLWLADLELRDLAGNTKENYRTCLRLHVRPAFEHYTLAEVTTGRVEWFLARQAKVSPSQAKQTRTLLNMIFGYALRHDAIARNPVEGTSQLRRAKATPQALSIDQIAAIRDAEGIHSVGVDRILKEAGVTRATMYRHFHGKEALVVAYLDREDAIIRGYFEAAAAAGGTPSQLLKRVIDGVAEDASRYHRRGCPFINAAAEYPDAQGDVRAIIGRHRTWFRETLTAMCKSAGVPKPAQAAAALVLLRDAALVGAYLDGDSVTTTFRRTAREVLGLAQLAQPGPARRLLAKA